MAYECAWTLLSLASHLHIYTIIVKLCILQGIHGRSTLFKNRSSLFQAEGSPEPIWMSLNEELVVANHPRPSLLSLLKFSLDYFFSLELKVGCEAFLEQV